MELGISRGQFQVFRIFPSEGAPDGSFVLRITDVDSGIAVVASLTTEDGLRFGAGFNTDGDAEHAAGAPVIAMPNGSDRRRYAGEGRGEALEHATAGPDEEPPAA